MHTKRTARHFKPIAKNKQDHWMMWDGVMKRKLTLSKLQRIQQPELYHPSKGMMRWPLPQRQLGKDLSCPLCTTPASLKEDKHGDTARSSGVRPINWSARGYPSISNPTATRMCTNAQGLFGSGSRHSTPDLLTILQPEF